VRRAQPEPPGQLDLPEQLEPQGQQVLPEQQAQRERPERQVLLVAPVRLVQPDQRVHRVHREQLVLPAQQAPRERSRRRAPPARPFPVFTK
jgi:hypothetical protein